MEIIKYELGPVLFKPKKFYDKRGFFSEIFHKQKYENIPQMLQMNFSMSYPKCIRGLHAQKGQSKLVTVIQGSIFDVAVHIESGRYVCVNLEVGEQFYIPDGFAHGFCVTSNSEARIVYQTNELYKPELEYGIRYDDPDLGIPWTIKDPIVSDRDKSLNFWKKSLHV